MPFSEPNGSEAKPERQQARSSLTELLGRFHSMSLRCFCRDPNGGMKSGREGTHDSQLTKRAKSRYGNCSGLRS
jgi:hypothetical protein